MIIHIDILISGRVQGVGFRYSALSVANSLHIRGFVKNRPHGEVYIEAEGEENNLNEFIAWCHQGPRMAMVTNVITNKGEVKHFSKFTIEA